MTHSVTLPQDIIYKIIEAVGDDDNSLRRCALVSSSFLLPSRKQLFSQISLRSSRDPKGLYQFLIHTPLVQSFVRSIVITQPWAETADVLLNSMSLLAILRLPFRCLESFSVDLRRPFSWSNFSSELQDAFSNIIHSSTLKRLCLRYVINVPITLFLGIVHLTKLELDELSPNDIGRKKSSSLTPEGVATTACHTVIDQCVWSFRKRVQGPTEPIFLPFICRLRYFEIYVRPRNLSDPATLRGFNILSFLIRSLCVSLTSPATLEHLKFEIYLQDSSDYHEFLDDLRDADVWSDLDSIITHPTGSRLQRVDIDIKYQSQYRQADRNQISETVLDALPLLRKKGVVFVETSGWQ